MVAFRLDWDTTCQRSTRRRTILSDARSYGTLDRLAVSTSTAISVTVAMR